ncbi:hypothetical protein [Endozoicomonas elysicola]|uniref:Uncharacterized protein n=1 Tax=Endozoicomonas elysicola TaxID=305900 RepID=A0A081K8R0_9GAMM|nr:hypothetical protein [Endozoicomonas elysicola]KEI70536.1 hypothetical protein GV64_07090 [Endozoicomonas elysicola]
MKHQISADDQRFKKCVEECSIPVTEFNHLAHVRLAYIYLAESDVDEANRQLREVLIRLLKHNNINPVDKYHETLTRGWLLAVYYFMKKTKDADSAEAFINANDILLDSQIMMTHYSSERLFSGEARQLFVEPDLEAFPL